MDIYEDIRNFLGQQNFALTATSNAALTILQNAEGGRNIFCVVADFTKKSARPEQIADLNRRLLSFNGTDNDVLFVIVTDDAGRDKELCRIPEVRLWLADSVQRRLLVFENQPEDFYGLRFGLEETIAGCIYPEKTTFKTYKAGLKKKTAAAPYVTAALIAANVIYFTVCATRGSLSDSAHMLKMGANYGVYVFEKGQIWRLITGMFMHFSFYHLAGNMFYLGVAGYNLEKRTGHLKFFLTYMLSGFGASLVSAGYYYLSGTDTISAGASGAVYGLIGAMLIFTYKNRGRIRSPRMFARIGIIIIFLYYSNFTTEGVDAAAHIAGFVFGIILSLVFSGGAGNERR